MLGAAPAPAEGAELVASTDVSVITLDESEALRIAGVSEDVVGSEEEVRALTLAVEAVGQGALSYRWTRTVDGTPDQAFLRDGPACSLDDVHAGRTYAYAVTVTDETGATASAEVQVRVTAASDEYARERITYPLLGVTIEANRHRDARFVVSVQPVGTDAFLRLLDAADGARLRPPAYSIRVEGQPEGQPAFVGEVRVSFPSPGQPALARAWAAEGEGEAVEVLLANEAGGAQRLTGTEAGGWVTFETDAMGDFAVLADEVEPLPSGSSPSESGDGDGGDGPAAPSSALSPTGDAVRRGPETLAILACAAGAAALLSLAGRTPRRRRAGR